MRGEFALLSTQDDGREGFVVAFQSDFVVRVVDLGPFYEGAISAEHLETPPICSINIQTHSGLNLSHVTIGNIKSPYLSEQSRYVRALLDGQSTL